MILRFVLSEAILLNIGGEAFENHILGEAVLLQAVRMHALLTRRASLDVLLFHLGSLASVLVKVFLQPLLIFL
jgi:hypothetical protein